MNTLTYDGITWSYEHLQLVCTHTHTNGQTNSSSVILLPLLQQRSCMCEFQSTVRGSTFSETHTDKPSSGQPADANASFECLSRLSPQKQSGLEKNKMHKIAVALLPAYKWSCMRVICGSVVHIFCPVVYFRRVGHVKADAMNGVGTGC